MSEYDIYAQNPAAYPEHYLQGEAAPVYCPDYWDWPLAWYGGAVDIADAELADATAMDALHPAQWLNPAAPSNAGAACTARDVCWNAATAAFVLHWEGRYYRRWGNSDEWNDAGGHPRPGTLYCRMTESGDRDTRRWDGAALVDFLDGVTDFAEALDACVRANGGSIRLRPGRAYYVRLVSHTDSSTPWRGLENFTADGQGATIFTRGRLAHAAADGKGHGTAALFRLRRCKNAVLRRFRLRAVRDNVDSCPAGMRRVSFADSRLAGFGVMACQHLTFEDIDCQGLGHDFITARPLSSDPMNTMITISGWRSRDFTQNCFADTEGLAIYHARLRQAPLAAPAHVLYFYGRIDDARVIDSAMVAETGTSSVMVQAKIADAKDTAGGLLSLERVTLVGPKGVQLYNAGAGRLAVTLEDCTLCQADPHFVTSTGATSVVAADGFVCVNVGTDLTATGTLGATVSPWIGALYPSSYKWKNSVLRLAANAVDCRSARPVIWPGKTEEAE